MEFKGRSALKSYKGVSGGLRGRRIVRLDGLNKLLLDKSVSVGLKKASGRNYTGRITCRHRGGGHKRKLRYLDFSSSSYCNVLKNESLKLSYEYDSCRTSFVSRGVTKTLKSNYRVSTGSKIGVLESVLRLSDVVEGSRISNVGGFCRAAGSWGVLLSCDKGVGVIRLPSKRVIELSSSTLCVLGPCSNVSHKLRKHGKAGAKRWLGIRPTVRGCAMNAVDHPNGGKTAGGEPRTKWGKSAKWYSRVRK